jgi:hypothetical protein
MLLRLTSLLFVLCKFVRLLALRERHFTVRLLVEEEQGLGFVATSPASKINKTT